MTQTAARPADAPVAEQVASPSRARWARRAVAGAYVAFLVGWVVVAGVPTGRPTLAVMVMVGLSISTIGQGWRAFGQVFLDWLPFTLVLMAYDWTRGISDTMGMPLHEADVVGWERAIGFGHIPTVWLQQHLYDPSHVHWYDALCTLIYTSHFLASPILAAVLWLRDRRQWVRFISRVITLSVLGLSTYILFPEAPPWLAARDGLIAPVARLSSRGWEWLQLGYVHTTLDHAQQDGVNAVAAMPSLHVAFASLVALFIADRLRTRWRYLLAIYPLAMTFTLVYTGEHYVLDALAGYAYALVVHLGLNRFERHRAARRATSRATDGTARRTTARVATSASSGEL